MTLKGPFKVFGVLSVIGLKKRVMSDIDFLRLTAMFILPKCIETSDNPIKDAVDFAEELLKECQKRENL